jgi:hypothetical protein
MLIFMMLAHLLLKEYGGIVSSLVTCQYLCSGDLFQLFTGKHNTSNYPLASRPASRRMKAYITPYCRTAHCIE